MSLFSDYNHLETRRQFFSRGKNAEDKGEKLLPRFDASGLTRCPASSCSPLPPTSRATSARFVPRYDHQGPHGSS